MNKLKFFELTKELTHKEFRILICLLTNPTKEDVYKLFNMDCSIKKMAEKIAEKTNPFQATDILNSDLIFDTKHFDNIDVLGEAIKEASEEIINENTDC